jgi:hypothetical protein
MRLAHSWVGIFGTLVGVVQSKCSARSCSILRDSGMSQTNAKKDVISSIRFYVDKIVSDPSIGGSHATQPPLMSALPHYLPIVYRHESTPARPCHNQDC